MGITEDNVYKVFSTQLSRIPCSMNFSSCVYYSFKTFPSRNEIYPLRGHMAVHRHILVVGRSQEYYYTFCNVQESIPSPSMELFVTKCLWWEGSIE